MARAPAAPQEKECFRWWVLLATALGMFAYGYTEDNVVALQRQLLETYHLSNVQYNLLYSVFTAPNIILPICIGILSDKYGYTFLLIFLFGLMFVGQSIYVFGCYKNGIYPLLLLGRIIVAIGAECHALVETPFLYYYFKNRELAFGFAVRLALYPVGSSFNDIASYLAYTHFNGRENEKIAFAGAISLIILIMLWIGIIIIVIIHKKRTRVSQDNNDTDTSSAVNVSDIKKFDSVYWVLTWNCAVMYVVAIAWINIGSDYLQMTYEYSHKTANIILNIPYMLASILQPLFGWLSDKYGHRSQLLLVASVLYVSAHFALLMVRTISPIYALMLLGSAYALFTSVIWACYPFVVDERILTTAYGIPLAVYNLVATVSFIIVGALTSDIDNTHKYDKVELFLFIMCISSVTTSLYLIQMDARTGLRLNETINTSHTQQFENLKMTDVDSNTSDFDSELNSLLR